MPDLLRHRRGLSSQESGQYIELAARSYSHQVWVELFRAGLPGRWPWVMMFGMASAGGAAAWWRPDVALSLTLLAAVSLVAQAGGWLHIGRLFSWHTGQNTIAVIPSAEVLRHRVVLTARWNMARVPQRVGWLTPAWERLLLRSAGAAAVLMPVLLVLGLLGVSDPWWAFALCLLITAVAGLLLLLRELSAKAAGRAPENASGVAVALHLGEVLAKEPLRHTEVWTVFAGCPEGGLHALLDRYGQLLTDAHLITIDCTSPVPGARAANPPTPGSEAHAVGRRGFGAMSFLGGAGHDDLQAIARLVSDRVARIDGQE